MRSYFGAVVFDAPSAEGAQFAVEHIRELLRAGAAVGEDGCAPWLGRVLMDVAFGLTLYSWTSLNPPVVLEPYRSSGSDDGLEVLVACDDTPSPGPSPRGRRRSRSKP
jgi:hypothetical protein